MIADPATTDVPVVTDRRHRTAPRLPRWLGVPFLVRLAIGQMRRRPIPSIAAAAAGAVGGGLFNRPVGGGIAWAALLLVATTSAALASATDPAERERARLIIEQGCPRTVVRLARWVSAFAPPAAAGSLAAIVGVLVPGAAEEYPDASIVLVLLAAASGAWATAGSVLPERYRARSHRRAASAMRVTLGVVLAAVGIWFVVISTSTGSNVDLALPVAFAFVFGAFALVGPAAIGAVAAIVERIPRPVARLGATSTARNRRGLTLPVTMIAALACVLVVMVVVGEGLGAREAARRQALTALGPATVAGSSRFIVVRNGSFPIAPEMESIQKVAPDALAADILEVPLQPRSGRVDFGEVRTNDFLDRGDQAPVDVALATPELLSVLGLDAKLATGQRAVVLDARTLRPDQTVRLEPPEPSVASPDPVAARPLVLPAIVVRAGTVAAGLPAVLLPRRVLPPLGEPPSDGGIAIVRLDHRPSVSDLDAIRRAVGARSVIRGDEPVDVLDTHRTDRVDSILVRGRADSYRLLAELLAVATAAAGLAHLAIRLATRWDDAILLDLGAERSTLVRVAAVRAGVVAIVAVGLGAAIGLGGVAIGLARYRQVGRFSSPDPLAPVPFAVPAPVGIGLVGLLTVVVLVAVAASALAPPRSGPPRRPT